MRLIERVRSAGSRPFPRGASRVPSDYLLTAGDRRCGVVAERVMCVSHGDRLYARLPATGDVARFVWETGTVAVCRCDRHGRPTGAERAGVARILSLEEQGRLERALTVAPSAPRLRPAQVPPDPPVPAGDTIYVEIVALGTPAAWSA